MTHQNKSTEATRPEPEEGYINRGEKDPFPEIQPALLNSSDIYAYALATQMINPFPTDEENLKEKLKPASYEIDFLGDVYHNKDGKEQHEIITAGKRFVLKKNSIAFVFLETIFRIPDYIAIRFNLRITHVHKGLLLGTGPLVDPGFTGRLLIPLHNLTANDYILTGGEGLIWVEFTKLSSNPRWKNGTVFVKRERRDYSLFPRGKRDTTAHKYFDKASFGIPAESSIPESMREAKQRAVSAERSAKVFAGFGALAIAVALISIYSLVQDANNNITSSAKDNVAVRERLVSLEEKFKALEAEKKLYASPAASITHTYNELNMTQKQNAKAKPPITPPKIILPQ